VNVVVSRTLAGLALAGLAAGGWLFQRRARAEASAGVEAPSPAAEMIVAGLGGFRGIAAEVLWFRAERLQSEGRFGELAQLSTWLTYLEPRTSEVWVYAAWNLAFNVSVMMPAPEARWRWVDAGIRLLRDDGLRLNPGDPVLHRQLAWIYLQKLSGNLDRAAAYYRTAWRETVTRARAEGRLAELGLDADRTAAIDAEYGAQDWGDPLASALLWAARGLPHARRPEDRAELRLYVCQALMLESRKDARFAPRAVRELRTACAETPSRFLLSLLDGFRGQFGLD